MRRQTASCLPGKLGAADVRRRHASSSGAPLAGLDMCQTYWCPSGWNNIVSKYIQVANCKKGDIHMRSCFSGVVSFFQVFRTFQDLQYWIPSFLVRLARLSYKTSHLFQTLEELLSFIIAVLPGSMARTFTTVAIAHGPRCKLNCL